MIAYLQHHNIVKYSIQNYINPPSCSAMAIEKEVA